MSVGVLLLLHHHSDYIPFRTAGYPPALTRPGPVEERLDALCAVPDPFDLEYGRTNIRLTRAYEGKSGSSVG